MNTVRKNELGFGIAGLILLLVLTGAIISVGWYVWHVNKNIKVPVSLTTPTSSTPAKTTDTKPAANSNDVNTDLTIQKITYGNTGTTEQVEIKKRIYAFYTAWNILSSHAEQFSDKATSTNEAYLTKAAQQQQKDDSSYALFTCSQMKQESIAIGDPMVSGSNAEVTLTPTEIGITTPGKPINLSVVKQQSGWFIDHVTCSF